MRSIYVRQSKMHMHACQQQSSYPNLQPASLEANRASSLERFLAKKSKVAGF
jgi:hypothetical protein